MNWIQDEMYSVNQDVNLQFDKYLYGNGTAETINAKLADWGFTKD